ncbi:hypothetical protein P154DRAFT_521310 [Amniculicola lignicola CBS 123094]|uniref:Uncharacterized protein n=1 Tax=Amniculicola lignicola CBS 123094 TaxID=1392246 RepID=A0A6A5WKI6_9PLEO|nr:hypothetical protein P154DRAFT_521310 [Amniculicola lignicola CBS 123094]
MSPSPGLGIGRRSGCWTAASVETRSSLPPRRHGDPAWAEDSPACSEELQRLRRRGPAVLARGCCSCPSLAAPLSVSSLQWLGIHFVDLLLFRIDLILGR